MFWRGEGKDRAEWDRTSTICVLIANQFRSEESEPARRSDFHPHGHEFAAAEEAALRESGRKIRITKESIGTLKVMVPGEKV